ncbi:MAG: enoyl-CoA hydratase/isomerase family protein, partial [Burkholderiales bacterium]
MEFTTIRLAVDRGVATLTLERPRQRNAIDLAMRAELREAVARLRSDAEIRAVVLTGAQGNFCAGGDIRSMQQRAPSVEQARRRMRDSIDWAASLLTLDKPVVAAVDGAAYGAGFSLARAADFIVATPAARFCASFGRMGLIPDFGCHYTLPRRIGMARARELIYSAREVLADEALALGIVYRLVPAETLVEEAAGLAGRFVDASPTAIGISKTLLDQTYGMDLRQMLEAESNGQAICFESEYHRDAVERFLNKQPLRLQWPT